MERAPKLHLIGFGSGIAGVSLECGQGPEILQQSSFWPKPENLQWEAILKPELKTPSLKTTLRDLSQALSLETEALAREKALFVVTGGDHSSAIGTWSGVSQALKGEDLGLIWIDAHMDSHIPETSQSGRYHGMPLAALMGQGDSAFTELRSVQPKLKPEHVCLIGVRSYEPEEAALLKRLGVKVYFMEEVKERGLGVVFAEALARVKQGTVAYGISVDVDSLDPQEAPGVDVPEPEGLKLKELVSALATVAGDPLFIGGEVVEFNPSRDREQMTEKVVIDLIAAMTGYAKR